MRWLLALVVIGALLGPGCKQRSTGTGARAVQLPKRKDGDVPPIVKQARAAFEHREYDRVIQLLEGTVTDRKATPEHFYFLSMAYLNVARLPEAEDTLRRGQEKFPGYAVIREGTAYYQYVIGRLRLEEGDLDAAHAAFAAALAAKQNDRGFQTKVAGGYREGARRLIDLGNPAAAVTALEHAINVIPDQPPLAKALEDARRAAASNKKIAKRPADNDAALKRIIAEPGSGAAQGVPGAGAVMEAAADLGPAIPVDGPEPSAAPPSPAPAPSPSPAPNQAKGGSSPSPSPSPSAAPRLALNPAPPGTLEEAKRALEARDASRASSLAKLVLAGDPDDREALAVLARALDRQGKAREAIGPVQAYVAAHPDDSKLTLELARLKVSLLDSKGAEELADKLVALPDAPADEVLGALHYKAIARLQAGNVKGAEETLDAALAKDPEYPAALFVKGQIEEKRKNWEGAIGLFERATAGTKPDPERGRYLFRLGLAYRQTGQDAPATQTFQKVIAEDPGGPWAKKARAFAADPVPAAPGASPAPAGPTAVAAPASAAPPPAPTGNPEEEAELKAGIAAFHAKDLPKATDHFRKALELNPKNARTYFNLADLLHAQKDFAGEKETFTRLLAQNLGEKTNQQAKLMLRRLEAPAAKR